MKAKEAKQLKDDLDNVHDLLNDIYWLCQNGNTQIERDIKALCHEWGKGKYTPADGKGLAVVDGWVPNPPTTMFFDQEDQICIYGNKDLDADIPVTVTVTERKEG